MEDGRPQEYAAEIDNLRLVYNSPAPPVRFLVLMEIDFLRIEHLHAQLRNTATHCVQQSINQCPGLTSLTIERWTFYVRNTFFIASAAGNFTHLNVSVDSRPTREKSDSEMDCDGDGDIGDDVGLDRGIPTLQHANVIFAKKKHQDEGLTPRAVLQALAQSQDLREAVLKDVVLGQRILVARIHSEVNKIPYFPRLECLEIKPADDNRRSRTHLQPDVSSHRHQQFSPPHMCPDIVGQPERPRPSPETQDYEHERAPLVMRNNGTPSPSCFPYKTWITCKVFGWTWETTYSRIRAAGAKSFLREAVTGDAGDEFQRMLVNECSYAARCPPNWTFTPS
ncbi:hypothetical protein CGCFRS4_v015593 [Colletotrichum fructicola]|nr:hypothetical protein CGCFRS4_v015593 [Colletotrichum fructicola]